MMSAVPMRLLQMTVWPLALQPSWLHTPSTQSPGSATRQRGAAFPHWMVCGNTLQTRPDADRTHLHRARVGQVCELVPSCIAAAPQPQDQTEGVSLQRAFKNAAQDSFTCRIL